MDINYLPLKTKIFFNTKFKLIYIKYNKGYKEGLINNSNFRKIITSIPANIIFIHYQDYATANVPNEENQDIKKTNLSSQNKN